MASANPIEIIFDRPSRTYHEGETIQGSLRLNNPTDLKHDGVSLTLNGFLRTFVPAKSAIGNGASKIQSLTTFEEMLLNPGKLPQGKHEVKFQIPIRANADRRALLETYHGVRIDIQYILVCEIHRGILAQTFREEKEIFVELKSEWSKVSETKPYQFHITPDKLEYAKRKLMKHVPEFSIRGCLDSTQCSMGRAVQGTICVDTCTRPIKSVEIQLIRSEQVGVDDPKDCTEVQNIQIADGDVPRSLKIPLHMVLPQLFACATIKSADIRVEFNINVLVILDDDHIVAESIPIDIYRHH
ncbi:hypothetical protein TCAL_00023 [Tigriopus californicus]|uniref:Arrestin C-terminal-like domain-containing protein n=1 Tax=Tigriopus californicus TaxID=6832 RepID=A0A553PHA3_TIGCA|nr:vacuolar protein sorting-associated protein 26C-like [Tigriopus californicus]TRY77069.1 hypothetical protein TCAL_00023 [Tigriopus californicus]|eukprot:TCALIF_00023-PA protein Name:"Similar to DSCR3 Down syndrome critical region protein 3 homolog (Pongo abelii)" AED:0.02 eAED:0.02 QI:0/-1/0/1/-1/1/1/0/298